MERPTQAVILAGGRGERLRPLTNTCPKPMIMINGRPFLEHLIVQLKEQGFKKVVLLLGYLPEVVQVYFGDGRKFGIAIEYSITDCEDETGRRVRLARDFLDDVFLMMYCDNYWPMDIGKMFTFYEKMGVLVTTTVYNNKDGAGEYGLENNVQVSPDGYVLKYDRTRGDRHLNGVDMGFFIIDKRVVGMIPEENVSFEQYALPRLSSQNQLAAYQTDHQYYFITRPDLVSRMEEFLLPKKVVILDRDGVINKKMAVHDYVKCWEEFEFLPHAIEALKVLKNKGYDLYLITNQRGIARGLMTENDLGQIHGRMEEVLARGGVRLSGIYYCPHEKDACECRKPKASLFYRVAKEHLLDLTKVINIGDSPSDLEAGQLAGCKNISMKSNGNLLELVEDL